MYLNCHSYYSLRYGVMPVEELVARGKAAGADALCLTDINTMMGVYDFTLACKRAGITPVAGIEFREGNTLRYIGIARNIEGFQELNRFLSERNIQKTPFPLRAPLLNNCFFIYPLSFFPQKPEEHEYLGVRPEEVNKIVRSRWERWVNKMVVLNSVTFADGSGYNLHRALRCVDQNILATRLTPESHADITEMFLPIAELVKRYERYPAIVFNTARFISRCSFDFDFDQNKNIATYDESRSRDLELLTELAKEGMERRYGKDHREARARMEKELEIIERMGFAAYFLTAWDIIRYSQSKGYWHVGRGSGANSIIAYLIGITDVCPLELNLYFERFLNPARSSPPDFDIDWAYDCRDEIFTYIFQRFGEEKVCCTGAISEWGHSSVSQELGKVFGLNQEERNRISGRNGSAKDAAIMQKIERYAERLAGFPNKSTMHSCGILVTDVSRYYYTAVDVFQKGFSVAQIDMYMCEDINWEKIDILSQCGLAHIKEAVELVERNHGTKVDISDVNTFKNDPVCNDMLAKGKTIGVFYAESPAMRGLLRRTACGSFPVLIAATSIIRPGVAQSGMMKEYIDRHNGMPFSYPHPAFEEHLSETYGIMVYQEDVIKIAHHYAGLDLSDADILRRAMTGKRKRPEFERVKQKFFDNCRERGYPEEVVQNVYRQIESFGAFSFCKAHSASYSVETYQSLYLKSRYPLEFITAVINNEGGFYRTEVYVHEARRAGAAIHQPCINNSEERCDIRGTDLYLGLSRIRGLDSKLHVLIPEERIKGGSYKSIDDFLQRIPVGIEQVRLLIFTGALRSLGKSKGELFLEAHLLFSKRTAVQPANQLALFHEPRKEYTAPNLVHNAMEDVFDELELLHFPVTRNPFQLLTQQFTATIRAEQFLEYENKYVQIVGYLIARKPVPIMVKGQREHMSFGTWVDEAGDYFDTTHFPRQLKQYPFNAPGCYLLEGKIIVDYGFPMLEIVKCIYIPAIADPRYDDSPVQLPVGSRDNLPFQLSRSAYPGAQDRKKLFNNEQKY